MTDKIYILAPDTVADDCISKAINWSTTHPKFTKAENTLEIAVLAVSEYLANERGFTMYADMATYPKNKS